MNNFLISFLIAGAFAFSGINHLYSQITFDLKLFLEGPFNGTNLNSDLNTMGMLPLEQPYNAEPWDYTGNETVDSIPNADIVDWILVEYRETSGGAASATPSTIVYRQAAFVNTYGNVVDLDGISQLTYPFTITDNLYIVIWHRNHLAIMSSEPMVEIGGICSWDFTIHFSNTYLEGQKELGVGQYGMISGDCDGNGIINISDYSIDWESLAGQSGYLGLDLNMDGEVNNQDKDDLWVINEGNESMTPFDLIFTCGDQITDYDGNIYNTIEIGTQCWMAENLKTTTYRNGAAIDHLPDVFDWASATSGAYVMPENWQPYMLAYGCLYNWFAANDPGGLCPEGWHVATIAEWDTLHSFIGGPLTGEGNKLKSCRQVNSPFGGDCVVTEHPRWDEHPTNNGTDDFGFSALPAGLRTDQSAFGGIGSWSGWWAADDAYSTSAKYYAVMANKDYLYTNYQYKERGFSVRCIKDE